ncbi:hypothetical protein F5890DRAFT_1569451 [Lentinula detonsa]|uniref:Uncharacterized protein n=1 Tax=Lentinula detonsa TaxID=2804962 RepID=A0AA38UMA9_9AGAR|nr:hypothetical protein F5890DRAFT_1569451 [Lentinula detonsa]
MQLLPKTISINAHDRQRVTHANQQVIEEAEDERRKSHVLPLLVEVRRDQTTPDNPTFCHELHEAGRHFQIPLSLFTTPRLAYISANAHGLKKVKVSRSGKPNTSILDLIAILKHFGIDPKDPLDGLSFNEFRQAGRNLWQFEIARDGIQDGSGIRASWTKAHLGFWDSKPEAEALYRYWKPKEWKMREERFTYSLAFDLQDYRDEWSQTKSAADTDVKLEVLQSGLSTKSYNSPRLLGAPLTGSSTPFPSGSKGKSGSTSCCLGCGIRGHGVGDCSSSKLLWAVLRDGRLCTPNHESRRICLAFNIYGKACTQCEVSRRRRRRRWEAIGSTAQAQT